VENEIVNCRRTHLGFSLTELLFVVAAIGIVTAVAIPQFGGLREKSRQAKLSGDVDAINSAIDVYVANGGNLDGLEEPQAILDRLKTVRSAESAARFVGFTGSTIDRRLSAEMTHDRGEEDAPRAVWNPASLRFEISGQGAGVREFRLDENLAEVEYGEEERARSMLDYNTKPGWIWAYNERSVPMSPGITPMTTTVVAESPAPASTAAPSILMPPVFTPGGGIFKAKQFPLSVTLGNPNDSSTWLMVSINGGSFVRYGAPLSVPADSRLIAFATGDPTRWINSSTTHADYQLASPEPLLPPSIALSAPEFNESTLSISVSIADNNAPGQSTLYFAITDVGGTLPPQSSWTTYSGSISLSATAYPNGFTIAAYAKAIDPIEFRDSLHASQSASANFIFETPPAGSEVLYIIDVSGSMNEAVGGSTRIALVLAALNDAINRLPPSVRFTVATFSSDISWTAPSLELNQATQVNKLAMQAQIATFLADGSGTNYEAALRIPFLYSSNPTVVYFLTDGQPTSGGDFTDEVAQLAANGIRINTIGVDLSEESEAVLSDIAAKTKGKAHVAKTK
jgi:prepilin-type N-terminal cleavage/methylation domain-containing protein